MSRHWKVWLYAIRLDDAVLDDDKFVEANPDYRSGKPCYYVGESIYPPRMRFQKHKDGERSSKWVRKYGLHPAMKKCFQIEVTTMDEARQAESEYAEELRSKGYGIWQA